MPKGKAKSSSLGDSLLVEALGRIDSKLDRIDSRLDDQGKTLALQNASLDEHVRRTNMLEEKIDKDVPEKVKEEIRVQRNKLLFNTFKIGGAVAGLGGGGLGIHHAIKALWAVYFGAGE